MMSGSRGDAGALMALLNIVGDPKATTERIKQLQEATAANEKSLEKLKTKEADLDARGLELDVRETELEKSDGRVLDIAAALEAREKVIARSEHELALALSTEKAQAQTHVQSEQQKLDEQAAALAKLTDDVTGREKTVKAREHELDGLEQMVNDDRAKLSKFERELLARQAEIDKRYEALKALVT